MVVTTKNDQDLFIWRDDGLKYHVSEYTEGMSEPDMVKPGKNNGKAAYVMLLAALCVVVLYIVKDVFFN